MSLLKGAIHKLAMPGLLVLFVLATGSTLGLSSGPKSETFDADASGTGPQLGKNFEITLEVYDFSTPADTQILRQAFYKDHDHGLTNTLSKMKVVGRISLTGSLGYDVSYLHEDVTPTGRKITFVTNRTLRFGETYFDAPGQSYNLTVGELNLNDTDKSKSTGFLYPECKLGIDKQGQLQFELVGTPFKLANIVDWKGTPGVN